MSDAIFQMTLSLINIKTVMRFIADDKLFTGVSIYTFSFYRSMLFSNGAVMPSLDVRLSVCLSVRDVDGC